MMPKAIVFRTPQFRSIHGSASIVPISAACASVMTAGTFSGAMPIDWRNGAVST